jgi:hypothetical protein
MDNEQSSAWEAQHVSTCGVGYKRLGEAWLLSDQRPLNLGTPEAVSLLIHINI